MTTITERDSLIIAAAQAQADALAALNRCAVYPFDALHYETQAHALKATLVDIVRRWTHQSPRSRALGHAAYEHHITTGDDIATSLSKAARESAVRPEFG